jgi:hypothetical protein
MAGLVLIGRKLGDTWAWGQGETGNRIGSCGYFVRRRANHGRGKIHRALRLGGRGGATPLPSAALRRPPANFPVSGFPLSSWKMNRPVPAPEPEHLNQAPDGRDLRPEIASHFCTFAQAAGRFALLHTRAARGAVPTCAAPTPAQFSFSPLPPLPLSLPCPSHS